jgi:hypothetical protein
MAKKAKVYTGTEWVDLAAATADLSQYANLTTTPISGFRNAIINGGFDIWQRGTSFTPSSNLIYTADRFFAYNSGNGSMTVSRQTFTPGNTISGYEPQFFLRTVVASVGTSTLFNLGQRIEDVRKFAGQTVTVSFWMKSDASRTVTGFAYQLFGTGGSTFTTTQYGTFNVTTSWQRFTATVNIPSISGKTIGTDSYLAIELNLPAATQTTEIWGMQVEAGSVATPFEQRPIGTELALCQRYFTRIDTQSPFGGVYTLNAVSAANAEFDIVIPLPVQMRSTPTPSTNISAFISGTPTGTQVSLYRGGYVGGTWTSNGLRASKNHIWVAINGWSGSNAGTSGVLDIGPGVVFDASAEL